MLFRSRLRGYPQAVVLVTAGGRRITAERGTWFTDPRPRGPRPPELDTLILETPTACDPAAGGTWRRGHRILVTIGGHTIGVTSPNAIHADCGLHVSRYTTWR